MGLWERLQGANKRNNNMNNNIINLNQVVSMTSLEIADLTGKRHDHVIRDVRKMVQDLDTAPKNGVSEENYVDPTGRQLPMYRLDRKHAFILVSGYSVHLRAKCYDHIQALEQQVLQLEDQKKRAAVQSANRRGVTWGDYCKTVGLPTQKLMHILKKERKLFWVNPISGEWSVKPAFSNYFTVINPSNQRFSPKGINIRFNAKGLEYFCQPENVHKFREKLVIHGGTDIEKQRLLQKVAQSR
ncbi:Uncharacterized phage-encoded protein [Yersinia enterocolitica]|nr:Uncharacterized phage-encoded protein [Yersinia enterocolitica]